MIKNASKLARPAVLLLTTGWPWAGPRYGAAAAIGQKARYVSVVKSVVDSGTATDEKKKPKEIWSEWQDSNLRPLRPERSALPG